MFFAQRWLSPCRPREGTSDRSALESVGGPLVFGPAVPAAQTYMFEDPANGLRA
jgi:hypothetical protein